MARRLAAPELLDGQRYDFDLELQLPLVEDPPDPGKTDSQQLRKLGELIGRQIEDIVQIVETLEQRGWDVHQGDGGMIVLHCRKEADQVVADIDVLHVRQPKLVVWIEGENYHVEARGGRLTPASPE